jgi:ribosomal-protein-alanine N-acetyltransferase
VGGAQRQRTGAWNLNYRIAAAEQGNGFATELARAAYAVASSCDDSVAFIAWIDGHGDANTAPEHAEAVEAL